MKPRLLLLSALLWVAPSLLARDLHLTNGTVLRQVVMRLVEQDSISFIHVSGTSSVPFSQLSRADYFDFKVDQQNASERVYHSIAGGGFHDVNRAQNLASSQAAPSNSGISADSAPVSSFASRSYSTRSYSENRYAPAQSTVPTSYEQNFKPAYTPPERTPTVASYERPSYSTRSYSGDRYTPRTDSAPKTVHVRAYTTKSGVYVPAHERRAARR